jgi:hypothetical protein
MYSTLRKYRPWLYVLQWRKCKESNAVSQAVKKVEKQVSECCVSEEKLIISRLSLTV